MALVQVMMRRSRGINHFASLRRFSTEVSPVNILKEGKDPELKSTEEYPEWLQASHLPLKTFAQLERLDTREDMEEDRFIKLINRQRIKARNLSRS